MALTLFAEFSWKMPALPVDNWWFLAVVLVLLIIAIWLVARLTPSLTDDIDPAETHRQMLTAVRELHSQGELTAEEYRSIKSRLVEQLSLTTPAADSEGYSENDQHGQENKGEPPLTTETPIGNSSSVDKSSENGVDSSDGSLIEKDVNT
ncbi:MAG: hypothetical protein R3C59_13705 [Planctomycetaceae bacterium]